MTLALILLLQVDRRVTIDDVVGKVAACAKDAHVVWLIDPSAEYHESAMPVLFSNAILSRFPSAIHTVMPFGGRPAISKSKDLEKVGAAFQNLEADEGVHCVTAQLREAAKLGPKIIVLFTQANADAEDDLEATIAILKQAKITVFTVACESAYSDSWWDGTLKGYYWLFDPKEFKKIKYSLRGAETPYQEFPWGLPHRYWVDPTLTVPSGWQSYALTRIAAATGGRSCIVNARKPGPPHCGRYWWGCPMCRGGHKTCGAVYDEVKLDLTAPFTGSREEYLSMCWKDPLYRAYTEVWEELYKKALVASPPPLLVKNGRYVEADRPAMFRAEPWLAGRTPGVRYSGIAMWMSWTKRAEGARAASKGFDDAATKLEDAIEKFGPSSSLRFRATADALLVHLRILSCQEDQFDAFCTTMDKLTRIREKLLEKDSISCNLLTTYAIVEFSAYRIRHFYFLCHGGASLKKIQFLGDPKKLHAALDLADKMIERHRGTPWEMVIRHAGIAVFEPLPALRHVFRPVANSHGKSTTTLARPQRLGGVGEDDGGSGHGTASGN